jgi:hypothetical protein
MWLFHSDSHVGLGAIDTSTIDTPRPLTVAIA